MSAFATLAPVYSMPAVSPGDVDLPDSTTWQTLGQRPHLADAMKVREERLGAMLLQGFFAERR